MGREQKDVTFREAGGFLKPHVERGAVMGSARSAGGRENGLREDVAVGSILPIHSQGCRPGVVTKSFWLLKSILDADVSCSEWTSWYMTA